VCAGFEGCVSEFRINGDKLPLNGSSDRYDIVSTGGVSAGCAAVCNNNPCGGGHSCLPDGETYNCSAVAVVAEGGLEPGIIVVIVFFIILLIAIVIVFVLFRVRRGWFHKCLPVKGQNETARKNASGGKLVGSENSLHSHTSSRYAENAQLEEMIIRNHIAEELAGQKTSSLTAARPEASYRIDVFASPAEGQLFASNSHEPIGVLGGKVVLTKFGTDAGDAIEGRLESEVFRFLQKEGEE